MRALHVVTLGIGPGIKLLQNPGRSAHRAVDHGIAQGLGLGSLLSAVAVFHDLIHHQLVGPGLFFRCLGTGDVAHGREVEMDGLAGPGIIIAQPAADGAAPVAALSDVRGNAEHVHHQLVQHPGHATRPHRMGRTTGKGKTGQ